MSHVYRTTEGSRGAHGERERERERDRERERERDREMVTEGVNDGWRDIQAEQKRKITIIRMCQSLIHDCR